MTVFRPGGQARTMDFNANDVGYVPIMAGHYIENTGNTDLIFLEMFRANQFMDFSLDNWVRRLPPEVVTAHLNLNDAEIRKIPAEKQEIIAG
jgi:oxalate decarboxylase